MLRLCIKKASINILIITQALTILIFSGAINANTTEWNQGIHQADSYHITRKASETSEGYEVVKRVGVVARISNSVDGKQRLYFEVYSQSSRISNQSDTIDSMKDMMSSLTQHNTCKKDEVDENIVWTFNGQNIQMTAFCNEFPSLFREDETHFKLTVTPTTPKGVSFVINELKNAPNKIRIRANYYYNSLVIDLTAKGFSKAWRNHGGDAL
ncbi:MAG: hypothetical protein ACTH6O_00470 [Vibrio toranzoniae]